MRLTLSLLAVLLTASLFASSARAQAGIPYRRTIDYIPNRPYEFTGRYVRINANASFGQPTGIPGRTTNSMTLQAVINPGTGTGGALAGGTSSGSDVGNGAAAPAGAGGGKMLTRRGGLGTAGVGRALRLGR